MVSVDKHTSPTLSSSFQCVLYLPLFVKAAYRSHPTAVYSNSALLGRRCTRHRLGTTLFVGKAGFMEQILLHTDFLRRGVVSGPSSFSFLLRSFV